MKHTYLRVLVVLLIALLLGFFFVFDIQQYLTLDYLHSRYSFYLQYYEQNQLQSLGIYFIIFFLLTIVSLPGITIVSLAGGALFGFPLTLLVTSFADACGSTIAFMMSRYLFGSSLRLKYHKRLETINREIDKDGAFYLFSLRLMPFVPCLLLNLLMGVTTIRITAFYWATQLGKLPATAIYVNAGTQLGKIDSVFDIFSLGMIISFVMLGLFPLMSKKSMLWFNSRKEKYRI